MGLEESLRYLVVLVLCVYHTKAQVYGAGTCPQYQTSDNFNVQHISKLVEKGGLVPYLSSGTITERYQSCQYLRLQNGGVFSYTFKDLSNAQRTVTGSYSVVPSTYNQPGYLRLDMGRPGLLGSDVIGNVRLYPVLVDDDIHVFVACSNFGLFHAEYAYTFMQPGSIKSIELGVLKRNLLRKGIPLASSMTAVDQTCFQYDVEVQRNAQKEKAAPSADANTYNVLERISAADPIREAHLNPHIQMEGRPIGPRNPLWYDNRRFFFK